MIIIIPFVYTIDLNCYSFSSGYLVGKPLSLVKSNPLPPRDTHLCPGCGWGRTFKPPTSFFLTANHKQTDRATKQFLRL